MGVSWIYLVPCLVLILLRTVVGGVGGRIHAVSLVLGGVT